MFRPHPHRPHSSGQPTAWDTRVYILQNPDTPPIFRFITDPFSDCAIILSSYPPLFEDIATLPLPVDIMVIDLILQGDDALAITTRIRRSPACDACLLLQATHDPHGETTISVYGFIPRPMFIGQFDIATTP